jgi:hypothetical protein
MTASGESKEFFESGNNLNYSESAIEPRSSPINYEHGFCLYNKFNFF